LSFTVGKTTYAEALGIALDGVAKGAFFSPARADLPRDSASWLPRGMRWSAVAADYVVVADNGGVMVVPRANASRVLALPEERLLSIVDRICATYYKGFTIYFRRSGSIPSDLLCRGTRNRL
jgi:hypothetical protein